ncbi:carboxymuconolactone decarboxylase family protein (plasmid) [Deinococcus sp. KNUC1210]|uniref:carboxymuconolactone decarboxylase family protein n=1 Tax=Deinococcus sp. KNUC1210 TaxID=2917691 RepID=UPI001EF0EE18|nr:carboxymuconolactone decarboxylase family protein [Deinococcus sp. KNUC1210]ULH14050.1 carboxymuconolactone decarboxylase family protein [Deinococcus sp. KNUC1210]
MKQARIPNPALAVPGVMSALVALSKAAEHPAVSATLRELLNLRASQINGCSVCVEMHARDLKHAGETDERIFSVAAWRDTPYYTEAERAALALTEAATRLSDRPDPVPDDIWAEAARHYDEAALSSLTLAIASINVWNRINMTTGQKAGTTW